MSCLTRRKFLKDSAIACVAGSLMGTAPAIVVPEVLTKPRTPLRTNEGELLFRPEEVQSGRGPHLLEWAYTTDESWDTCRSNIEATREGIKVSDTGSVRKFGVDVRWNVEGFGYLFLTADNGGEMYELPSIGTVKELSLNFELANSRVARNRRRRARHMGDGWKPSREVQAYLDLSEETVSDAGKAGRRGRKSAELSQRALYFALWGGEMMELEKANFDIARRQKGRRFFFGCDARGFYQMYQPRFLELFTELFTYATITYVVKSTDMFVDFEPQEGKLRFEYRDILLKALREKNVTVEGRPLFWFHTWATPDWLKKKSFDELKKYIEKHTRDVITHYPEGIYAWEIMNEFHDWANEVQVTPEQAVELTKLACDVARDANPRVHRLINNCCPFAEYVQLKQWSGQPARYRQRTPRQFTRDLVDAGVDFTILGQQMYFPYRDLQDCVITIERLSEFKKPIQLSEVGAPGGPTNDTIKAGKVRFPSDPYTWHRPWDEELQADWLESIFTLAYSKPYIEAANWFDFLDPHSYIENGGLLRSPEGETKAAFDRLKSLKKRWEQGLLL